MQNIFYFGGKAKDLVPAIEAEMESITEAEERIALDDEQMRHGEEVVSDPE